MAEAVGNLTAIAYLLNTTAKSALVMRISCVFGSDDNLRESMGNVREKLRSVLPNSLLKSFYVTEENRPREISELSLRTLLMLCLSHPVLKEHFSQDDKIAIAKLNDSLMRLYCLHQGVEDIVPENQGQDKDSLESVVLDSLSGIGLNRQEVEMKIEEFKNDAESVKQAQNLWDDLTSDSLFEMAYLKRVKTALKTVDSEEELPENLKEAVGKIKRIDQSSFSLDSFGNVRQTLERSLDTFLICGFCKETLKKTTKTLPCLHSFCSDCLKNHLNSADKTVLCPTCQTRVSAPDANAIDNLPCTFVLSGLLNLQKHLRDKECSMDCALCVQGSTLYCLQTGRAYCRDHAYPLYQQDVSLVPATDLLDQDKVTNLLQSYCPQHRLILQQFCTSCQVPLCGSSACVTWHAQHGDLKALDEVIEGQKLQLNRLAALLKKKEEKVKTKIEQAEQNQVHVADLQENIRQSIQTYFSDIQKELEKRKQEFLRELDKAAELCWHQDEHTRQMLSSWQTKVSQLEDKFSNVDLSNGPSTDQREEQAVPGILESPVTNLSVLRQEHVQLLADTIGGGALAEAKTVSYPEGNLRTLLQTCSTLKSNICAVSGGRGWEVVAKTAGLRYFLVNRNHIYGLRKGLFSGCQVLVYDIKEFSSQPVVFCESGTRDYQGLALNAQGQLLIPEDTQNNLEFTTLRLKKSVNIATYSVNRERSGVMNIESLNTFGKIILKTVVEWDRSPSTRMFLGDDQCICELNSQGQTLRKFDFYTLVGIADFAPETERDLLAVTDGNRHNLLIFNCRQQQMVTIGGQGATPGTFSYPSGVCLDRFGHIFVADAGNSRVQIFDFAGKFLKLITYPQSLKDVAAASNTPANARVVLQVFEDYLYMLDYRMDTIWRVKYI